MTAQHAEVCRISVYGPGGRADLAVPLSATVAGLMPVLLRRASDSAAPPEQANGWVLQRLGEAPLDQSGTPETLGWRDGDELYLRPAAEPLPELDFDDIADGVAAAVNRHPGRWRPEFNRLLSFGFAIAAMIVFAGALLYAGAGNVSKGGAIAAAVGLLEGAIVAETRTGDRQLIGLLAVSSCVFAGLAGALVPAGAAGVTSLRGAPVLVGGLAMVFAGLLLLACRAFWARQMPFTALGVVITAGALAAIAQWLHLGAGLSVQQVAGLVGASLLVVLIFAPRVAIRLARLPGPQLPWTAEDLQQDVAPTPAAEVTERTAFADACLTVVTLASSLALAGLFPFLIAGGVFAKILAVLVALAALLHARVFRGVWQRVPLAAAGGVGLVLVGLSLYQHFGQQARAVSLAVIAGTFCVLVLAIMRPPTRRLLPIWGHMANWLETLSAIAVIPILLQLFGAYGKVRGLIQ
jgi:type VII secretion integral membrane protein EccD